jgi:hypothetical protein
MRKMKIYIHKKQIVNCFFIDTSTLGGSIVTSPWRVLRLRMEETASKYGCYLRIYWISSRGQLTIGGPPAGVLGLGLQLLTVKNNFVTKRHKWHWIWTEPLHRRPKLRKVDNCEIGYAEYKKMDLREIGSGAMEWNGLAQNRDQWRALVYKILGNSWVAAQLATRREGRITMKSVIYSY